MTREGRIEGPISRYKNNRGGNNNICTRRNQICIWQTRCRREGHSIQSNKRSIVNLNIFPIFFFFLGQVSACHHFNTSRDFNFTVCNNILTLLLCHSRKQTRFIFSVGRRQFINSQYANFETLESYA